MAYIDKICGTEKEHKEFEIWAEKNKKEFEEFTGDIIRLYPLYRCLEPNKKRTIVNLSVLEDFFLILKCDLDFVIKQLKEMYNLETEDYKYEFIKKNYYSIKSNDEKQLIENLENVEEDLEEIQKELKSTREFLDSQGKHIKDKELKKNKDDIIHQIRQTITKYYIKHNKTGPKVIVLSNLYYNKLKNDLRNFGRYVPSKGLKEFDDIDIIRTKKDNILEVY